MERGERQMTPDEALLYWERRKRRIKGLAHPDYIEAIDAAIKALQCQIREEVRDKKEKERGRETQG